MDPMPLLQTELPDIWSRILDIAFQVYQCTSINHRLYFGQSIIDIECAFTYLRKPSNLEDLSIPGDPWT
jgi:hypothetical protein